MDDFTASDAFKISAVHCVPIVPSVPVALILLMMALAFPSASCSGEDAGAGAEPLADQRLALGKESAGYLTPMAAGIREQFCRSIIARTADIERTLALSAERATALEALGANAVDKGIESWLKRAGKALASRNAEERKQIKRGQASIGALPSEMPDQQAAWKEGLAKLLTPDEIERLADSKRERRARRVRALAQMMLVQLDEKVAFTARQRERLQPVAERLVDAPAFFPGDQADEPQAIDFEPATFFAAALAVPENEMLEILDIAQCKRWREACDGKAGGAQPVRSRVRMGERKNAGDGEAAEPEPEDFESAMSDFFHEKTAPLRKRLLSTMALRVEEAVRLAGLGPAPTRRLEIAVRGATEESLRVWKATAEEKVRSLLGGVTAAFGKQSLSSIKISTLDQIYVAPAEEQPVWKAAVLAEMNEEQRAAWRREIDERSRFKFYGIASLILAELDRKVSISKEQWAKLEPMIAAYTTECDAEIRGFYFEGNTPWYLDESVMFIPTGGLTDDQLTPIFSKDQLNQWRRTPEGVNALETWPEVQQMRKERLKRPE